METIVIQLTAGVAGIPVDEMRKVTRKTFAHLSEEDIDKIMQEKDERFPPVVKKPKDAEPSTGG